MELYQLTGETEKKKKNWQGWRQEKKKKKTGTYWKRSDKTFCILLMTFLLWKSFIDLAYSFTVKIAPPAKR